MLSTFYQIYPIGFCGAPVHNDGVPAHRILKIGDWAEYLGNLGIGSIILNPIFESDNHGYDTRDFKTIDCRLGTNEDFKEVCEDLHKHNVKLTAASAQMKISVKYVRNFIHRMSK